MPPPNDRNEQVAELIANSVSSRHAMALLADLAVTAPPGSVIREAAERLHLVRHHQTPVPVWCVLNAHAVYVGLPVAPRSVMRVVHLGPAHVHFEEVGSGRLERVRYEHLSQWEPYTNPCGEISLGPPEPAPAGFMEEVRRLYNAGLTAGRLAQLDVALPDELDVDYESADRLQLISDRHAGNREEPPMPMHLPGGLVMIGGDIFQEPKPSPAPPSRFERDFDIDD